MTLTDAQIDRLIARRNRLTNRRGTYNKPAVDGIDAQLSQVPAGERNDIDLLLGRSCATLPKRVVMVQHVDGEIEIDYEAMSAGKPDGIVEHDDWLAGAP